MNSYTRRDALATVGALAATAALPLTARAKSNPKVSPGSPTGTTVLERTRVIPVRPSEGVSRTPTAQCA